MSTGTYDADAYRREPARIRLHQGDAANVRLAVFRALAAAGVPAERADELVVAVEAGSVAGAHTWIAESSAPAGSRTAGTRAYGRSPPTCCIWPTMLPPSAAAPPSASPPSPGSPVLRLRSDRHAVVVLTLPNAGRGHSGQANST